MGRFVASCSNRTCGGTIRTQPTGRAFERGGCNVLLWAARENRILCSKAPKCGAALRKVLGPHSEKRTSRDLGANEFKLELICASCVVRIVLIKKVLRERVAERHLPILPSQRKVIARQIASSS